MNAIRVLVVGDSHTRALALAHAQRTLGNSDIHFTIRWFASEKPGVVRGDLSIQDAELLAGELTPKDLVVVTVLGTAHNMYGLFDHEQPYWIFDEIESEQREVPMGRQLIPRQTVSDLFTYIFNRNRRLRQLLGSSSARMLHLMTPPPKEDNDFLQSRVKRRGEDAEKTLKVAPAELRLRLWRLEMNALSKVCRELGYAVMPVPKSALSPTGFLARKYYADDATHANAAYGELVLQQLEAFASGNPKWSDL